MPPPAATPSSSKKPWPQTLPSHKPKATRKKTPSSSTNPPSASKKPAPSSSPATPKASLKETPSSDAPPSPAPASQSEHPKPEKPKPTITIDDVTYPISEIAPDGNVLLVVTFETSSATLKATRKSGSSVRASLPATTKFTASTSIGGRTQASKAELKKTIAIYRCRISSLTGPSTYFAQLLGSEIFAEGLAVREGLEQLKNRGLKAEEVSAEELPRVGIVDDDEATISRSATRSGVFGDLLRILHGVHVPISTPPKTGAPGAPKMTVAYLVTLAVMADRFACAAPVARWMKVDLKSFKWPATPFAKKGGLVDVGKGGTSNNNGAALSLAAEEQLRQKILIAWLLDQPLKLASFTKELILKGSVRWSYSADHDIAGIGAVWWDLPDGLEEEIWYRRCSILNTVASLQKHFLGLYTSRTRQCKQFYDSSAACDSFQLGEMVKFFASKGLLTLGATFAPSALGDRGDDEEGDGEEEDGDSEWNEGRYYQGDIEALLHVFRQCPSYQIDKNHTHCGLRTRIMGPLDLLQSMIGAGIGIERRTWLSDRGSASWENTENTEYAKGVRSHGEGRDNVFKYTRAVDSRLRVEGMMAADKFARRLFTAQGWDWTPEDGVGEGQLVSFGTNAPRLRPGGI